jgi:hypothetical protein
MHTTTSNPKIKLRNAEQFLGSKRKRYFTSGFKKINCILGNYQYSEDKLTKSKAHFTEFNLIYFHPKTTNMERPPPICFLVLW